MKIIDIVKRFGGLTNPDGTPNFFGNRGRAFCALERYPHDDRKFLVSVVTKFREVVEKTDESLIYPASTHLLTLWYPDKRVWVGTVMNDRLKGGNNGDDGAPVYSLTIGILAYLNHRFLLKVKERFIKYNWIVER